MNTKCLISVIALTSSIGLFTSTASVAAPNVCGNGGWSLFGFASNGDCNSSLRNGALTWQIIEDFLVFPNQENPNRDQYGNFDTWWYMMSPTLDRVPNTYLAFQHYTVVDDNRENWDNEAPIPPSTQSYPFVGIAGPNNPYIVTMHPANQQLAVLRWKSPVNGYISMKSKFNDLDGGGGDGINWYVDHQTTSGVTTLAEGTLDRASPDYPREATFGLSFFAVSEGDVIDFVVHPRGTGDNDLTSLEVTIIGPLLTE